MGEAIGNEIPRELDEQTLNLFERVGEISTRHQDPEAGQPLIQSIPERLLSRKNLNQIRISVTVHVFAYHVIQAVLADRT